MNKTILLICLDKQYAREIAEKLCEKTGQFYLDCQDLLAYELSNREEIITNCGIEYLKKQQHKLIKNLLDYENTVIVIDYDFYLEDENYKILNPQIASYYLFLDKSIIETKETNIISQIAFEQRDSDLRNICKKVINCTNKPFSKIISQIT